MKFLSDLFPFNMCSNTREGRGANVKKESTQSEAPSRSNDPNGPFADVPDSDEVVTYRLNMR